MNEQIYLALILVAMVGVPLIRLLIFRPKGSRQEMEGRATVVSKRVKQNSGGAAKTMSRWDYMVTFRIGNTELELYVNQSRFKELQEGMTGVLRWQRESLTWFEPDENGM